jgi:MFS family permease
VTDPARAAAAEDGDGPGDALAVWLLAVGQTLGFASLLYIFGALIVSFEAGLGWTKSALSLGPTASLIVSAAAAPFMGRLVDRGLGAELLSGGALLGGLALAGLSLATTQTLWIMLWALVGLAHAASLYDVCFAFLTRRLGGLARPAIIRVTLVAGFASALAFPLGAAMAAAWGWQGAVLGFAAIQLGLTAPVNWIAGARLRRRARVQRAAPLSDAGALRAALGRPEFWLLTAIFGLCWMNHSILVTYFIPVFTDLGASPGMAVAAAATVGPFQFVGRFLLMLNETRVTAQRATAIAVAGLALASAALIAAGAAVWLIFLFAMLQGAGIGLMSILRPVLSAEVLGRRGFGAITGVMAMAPLLATASAPLLGAVLQDHGGTLELLAASLGIALLANALAAVLRARQR